MKRVLFVAVAATMLQLHADSYDDGTFVWSYSENGDGSVNIVDAVPSDGQNVPALVTIPAMIDGKRIRRVDNFLYGRDDYKTNIHTLIISYGIEQLRPFVFHGCVSLETVTIEADLLDYEGHNASPFADCPIKRVVFGEKATRVPRWMFYECDTLESFFFTGDMKEVGDVALYGCTVLSNVIVKGNADAFHISAFRGSPFYASIMESDALFELAIHKDVLLGYKHCTKIILPEDQPSTIVGARKTYEIIVPEGVKHIADRALSIATGNSGNGGWGWTVDFSKITLPDGLETIGSNAFGYQSQSTDGVERLLTIPSSVRRIGSNLFTQTFDGTILFLGAKPEAETNAFVAAHAEYYGCDLSKTTVAYVEGAPGWKYGETWCGVKTYSLEAIPPEYRAASTVRFAGGPHKGYRFKGQMKGCPCKQDDYELGCEDPRENLRAGGDVGTYRTTDGMFFALPVVGARSKSEVRPFLQLLTAKQDMIASVEVWSDDEMWKALTGAVTADWESVYDGRLCERYFDDWASMTFYYRGWDKSLWPEGRSVDGRHWVFVKLNDLKYLNSSEWGGDYTLRVGLEGTSEWSRTLHVSIKNESALNALASTRGLTIRDVTHVSVDAELHNGGGDPFSFSEYELQSGAFPLSFRIDLPEPGTLYLYGSDVSGEDDSVAARDLEITGSYKGLDREIYLDGYSSENNPWWPTTNFCAYAGACVIRAVDVLQGMTLQLRGKHPQSCEVDLVRLQFFPARKKSVAIEATSGDLAAWSLSDGGVDYDAMIYGRVTGTGVYSSGEYVHLVAEPVAGESFDRWEVVLGSLPPNLDLRKQVLDFTMPEWLCGSAAERKQIVVRPVWKKRNAVTALPNVQGRGTVTGSGKYLAETQVTLTATPAPGYVFTRWSDGETSATRTLCVEDVDPGVEHVLYACFCRPEELGYTIIFKSPGSSDIAQSYTRGKVIALPRELFPSAGRRFVGWACSNGRRYDDGMLVFNLAQPGETVTMTAIWE